MQLGSVITIKGISISLPRLKTSLCGSTNRVDGACPYRASVAGGCDTDETLDAKSIVASPSRLPGVSACAIVFSDGLSLAGNIPTEYEPDALCALAPSIVKRIDDQMTGASLGPLNGMTLYCAKRPSVSSPTATYASRPSIRPTRSRPRSAPASAVLCGSWHKCMPSQPND